MAHAQPKETSALSAASLVAIARSLATWFHHGTRLLPISHRGPRVPCAAVGRGQLGLTRIAQLTTDRVHASFRLLFRTGRTNGRRSRGRQLRSSDMCQRGVTRRGPELTRCGSTTTCFPTSSLAL